MSGWIGVDLDGTLAQYDKWKGYEHIGEPIPLMAERVRAWLSEGRDVRIFTARGSESPEEMKHVRRVIGAWTVKHFGVVIPITNVKDYHMVELWDDRCKQVEKNTGILIEDKARVRGDDAASPSATPSQALPPHRGRANVPKGARLQKPSPVKHGKRGGDHGRKACSVCGQEKGITGFPGAATGGGDVCRKCAGTAAGRPKESNAAPVKREYLRQPGKGVKGRGPLAADPLQYCDRCGDWKTSKEMRGHLCIGCHQADEAKSGRKASLADAGK